MTHQEILDEFQKILRDIFDDDNMVVSDELIAEDVVGWDSLTQISILATVEDVFKIKLSISETRNLKNVGAFVDLIAQKVKG